MRGLRKAKRVRLHMKDEPGWSPPSIEGLLVARRRREYAIAVPQLHFSVERGPVMPQSKLLLIPRENVAFYEVISS
jgi:hypothetical protein